MKSKIISRASLTDYQINRMYSVFEKHYVDVSFGAFKEDLSEKTHVFLFTDGSEIVGFSTIMRKEIPQIGPGTFLFSGDTVLKKEYWGSKHLQTTFFRYIVLSKLRAPFSPLYWMLITKGYKTYLLMKRNFPMSFPCPSNPTPNRFKLIRDRFYSMKFGSSYSLESGLIQFQVSHGAVKDGMAAPPPEALENPQIAYFIKSNPDYHQGVELTCVAEIRFVDFLGHIMKYFIAPKANRMTPAPLPLVKRT